MLLPSLLQGAGAPAPTAFLDDVTISLGIIRALRRLVTIIALVTMKQWEEVSRPICVAIELQARRHVMH